MNVMVTGGAGVAGSQIAQGLITRGDSVTIYDNFTFATNDNLKYAIDKSSVVDGDILDRDALEKALVDNQIEKVIHTAAYVGGTRSMENPLTTVRVNIEGTINLLEAMKKLGLSQAIVLNSEEAYGMFQYEPVDENHPFNPTNPYAITKVAADHFCNYYRQRFGMNLITVLTSWVYGPGLSRNRIPKDLIVDALEGRKTVLPRGGHQKFDLTYVEDFVQGVLLALDKMETAPSRVYNITSGTAYTYLEVAQMIREIMPKADIQIGDGLMEYAPGYLAPQKGALDITRARRELGYEPKNPIREGLRKYVEHLSSCYHQGQL